MSVLLTAKWLAALPLFYWDDAFSVLEVRPGPEGVLTVFEREGFGRGLAFNNQYLLGGSGVLDDEQRQSHIPLLLHPSPERVCYAGLGTGITASGSLTLGNLRVELDAGLNLIVGKPGTRYSYASDGNPYLGFVKERRAAWPTDDSIPDRYRDLLEVGFLVSRLEVAYDMKHPGTAQLEAQLRSQFPVNVLTDPGSDWSLWAGNEATLSSLRSSTAPPANPPAAAP